MAFQEVASLDADNAIALGGKNKKTGKPNPTSAEGYYLGTRRVNGKRGESNLHFLQTSKGNLGVWGKTDLDRKLLTVKPGTMVRLTFKGMKATPNGDMYTFTVAQDTENTIEVGDLSASSLAGESSSGDTESYEAAEGDEYASEESYEAESSVSVDEEASAAERQAKVKALLSKGGKGGNLSKTGTR